MLARRCSGQPRVPRAAGVAGSPPSVLYHECRLFHGAAYRLVASVVAIALYIALVLEDLYQNVVSPSSPRRRTRAAERYRCNF